jgi:hypothetical protein
VRKRSEGRTPNDKWDNLFLATGSPEKVLLIGFKSHEAPARTRAALQASLQQEAAPHVPR